VVVGVVVILPLVVLRVDMVLIHILAHVDLSEDILELGVVVEGNGGEWVEVVGVDSFSLGHSVVFSLLLGLLSAGLVRLVGAEVKGNSCGVDEEVGAPSHAAYGAHCV